MEDTIMEEQHPTQQEDLVAVGDVFTLSQHLVELDHVTGTMEVEHLLREVYLELALVEELVQLQQMEVVALEKLELEKLLI